LTFSFDFDDSEAPRVIEVDYTTIDKIKKVKTYGKISKVKKNITAEVRDATIAELSRLKILALCIEITK